MLWSPRSVCHKVLDASVHQVMMWSVRSFAYLAHLAHEVSCASHISNLDIYRSPIALL